MENKRKGLVLISISDTNGIDKFAKQLLNLGFTLTASSGTAKYLHEKGTSVTDLSEITKHPEILSGRVKTLHPAIHAGILSRNIQSDYMELDKFGYSSFQIVICNLYPIENITKQVNLLNCSDNIDIGGVTLLRAAAKNYNRVTVVCDPNDYDLVAKEISENANTTLDTRSRLAYKVFKHTAEYDSIISKHFQKHLIEDNPKYELNLRYGINPHQTPAKLCITDSLQHLPLKVMNGTASYINICDALNAWQLVKELKDTLGYPSASSFKHISPAGVAIGSLISPSEARLYGLKESGVNGLTIAYAKARGSDPVSSYGDFIALSDKCDVDTAKYIVREVSDGIIAPSYEEEAFNLLRKKKNGCYCVIQIDEDYTPSNVEERTVYGLKLNQIRNNVKIGKDSFNNLMTLNKQITESAIADLVIGAISLKYTQSNSVCFVKDGQVIGISAGQQSRIHSTRLAGSKADNWWLRRHENVSKLSFQKHVKRSVQVNAIENYIESGTIDGWQQLLDGSCPKAFTKEDKKSWLSELKDVCLVSDAFFPFADNIQRAAETGVKYVACPSGSLNDHLVIDACNHHNMILSHLNFRLFHH